MKNIILFVSALLLSANVQAQNTNVTKVTKQTTTTIKDSDGSKKVVKEQSITARQNIKLQNADSTSLNKNRKNSPIELVSTTTVTNPDGTARTVAIDRSAVYQFAGTYYLLSLDPSGYVVTDKKNQRMGLLRATTTNSYIFRGKDTVSVGYFDVNGNLVLDTYDDDSDQVSTRTFMRMRK
jgi:hypothetical protein